MTFVGSGVLEPLFLSIAVFIGSRSPLFQADSCYSVTRSGLWGYPFAGAWCSRSRSLESGLTEMIPSTATRIHFVSEGFHFHPWGSSAWSQAHCSWPECFKRHSFRKEWFSWSGFQSQSAWTWGPFHEIFLGPRTFSLKYCICSPGLKTLFR